MQARMQRTRPRIHIIKSPTENVNNTTTLQNDDELLAGLDPSQKYIFVINLLVNSSAVADLKLGWSVPSGATIRYGSVNNTPVGVGTESGTATIAGAGAARFTRLVGEITMGSTRGTVNRQFAQNTAEVSNSGILVGSTLTIWKV